MLNQSLTNIKEHRVIDDKYLYITYLKCCLRKIQLIPSSKLHFEVLDGVS